MCATGYDLEALNDYFTRPLFLIYTGSYLLLVMSAFVHGRRQNAGSGSGAEETEANYSKMDAPDGLAATEAPSALARNKAAFVMAFSAAGCGTMQNVFLKGLSELISEALQGSPAALLSFGFWFLVLLTVIFAVTQLVVLNHGIRVYDAVLFFPLYQSQLIIFGTPLVFPELQSFHLSKSACCRGGEWFIVVRRIRGLQPDHGGGVQFRLVCRSVRRPVFAQA